MSLLAMVGAPWMTFVLAMALVAAFVSWRGDTLRREPASQVCDWVFLLVALLIILSAIGCGGVSPAGPSGTPSLAPTAAVTVKDGATGALLETRGVAEIGSRVEVNVPGYLPRVALFQGGDVYLWPQGEDYVRAIVYHEWLGRRLARWTGGPVRVDASAIPEAGDKAAQAVVEMTRITGVEFRLGSPGHVTLKVDAADPGLPGAAAVSYVTTSTSRIIGARVVFRSTAEAAGGKESYYRNTLLHEMGHVLGLGHSPDPRDVMNVTGRLNGGSRWGPAEGLAVAMMYNRRRPGNTAPDADPEFAGVGGTREWMVRCE